MTNETETLKPEVGPLALFLTFSRIAISGFGGLIFWSRYVLIERRRWLTEREFVELLVPSQILPGPNMLNLTVMVGYRFAGWAGAAASVAGFLGCPIIVVVGMGIFYQHYGTLPEVHRALTGMSSVAAGLLLATVIKFMSVLPRRWLPWTFVALAFLAVGVFRFPLLWVIAALAPWAIFAGWKEG
ncbi:MAG TPA: chromate transporter [Candidatus Binatia bacterium]